MVTFLSLAVLRLVAAAAGFCICAFVGESGAAVGLSQV